LKQKKEVHITNLDDFFWESTTREDLDLERTRSYADSQVVYAEMVELIDQLDETQAFVIKNFYSYQPKTAKEIAKELGISTIHLYEIIIISSKYLYIIYMRDENLNNLLCLIICFKFCFRTS